MGAHPIGPDNGSLQVKTYREGVAQKVGHDLVIDVQDWSGTVDLDAGSVELTADSRSLHVREGLHGLKPLSDKDRAEIRKNIDGKVLEGRPIAFRSTRVVRDGGRLSVEGELRIGTTAQPVTAQLEVAADGRVTGSVPLVQSRFGIKPYRGLMGALKVRDELEIVIDVQLPAA